MGLKALQHEGRCNLVVVAGAAVRHGERAGGGGFIYVDSAVRADGQLI